MGEAKRKAQQSEILAITTREFADAIDRLIRLRIQKALKHGVGPLAHPEIAEYFMERDEEAEMEIRKIADAMKIHSAAAGVYKGD